jgi:VWFA-related protein
MGQLRLASTAFLICVCTAGFAQQPLATPTAPEDPVLTHRPPPKPKSMIIRDGKIHLDVIVADSAGKSVTGLQPWDFKLLDNNQPRKILSFSAFDSAAVKPDPPVEILLLIDMANLPFQQVAFVRREIDEFLRQNGGKLRQPLSLILLTETGIKVQPQPSLDGNAIAKVVSGISGHISSINPAMGGDGYLERFQVSVKQLSAIAENEAKKPGRKLLIWVGPGWPLLNRPSDAFSEREQRRQFNSIVELSTRLREARIVLYSVAPVDTTSDAGRFTILYQKFLKGVSSPRDANAGNLALKVLVTQTGGQILGPDNDLVTQINQCIDDANSFYRISFDPPAAQREDEYHDLRVQVGRPGLTVRTNTGYYDQP